MLRQFAKKCDGILSNDEICIFQCYQNIWKDFSVDHSLGQINVVLCNLAKTCEGLSSNFWIFIVDERGKLGEDAKIDNKLSKLVLVKTS